MGEGRTMSGKDVTPRETIWGDISTWNGEQEIPDLDPNRGAERSWPEWLDTNVYKT